MPLRKMPPGMLIAVGAMIVFLSRFPFLFNGYGSDADAWRVANAARHTAMTGQYQASRLPGYPLQELACALIWKCGGRALAFNLTTAVLSVFSFVFFCLYLRRLQSRDFILGGATLVLAPVVFIHSTDAMDYIWALAPILGALYCALRDRPVTGGILLGLAIGCRVTSGAMLIPASLMLSHERGRLDRRRLAALWLPAVVIGASFYVPVVLERGLSFFAFVDSFPPIAKVIYEASVGVWGVIGSLAIACSLVVLVWRRRGSPSSSIPGARRLVLSWTVGLFLYAAAFLRLPHEGGYLVPAVPFVILLFGRFLSRTLFIGVCSAIIVSSFVVSVERTGVYAKGPVLRDSEARSEAARLIEDVILWGRGTAQERVLVTGWFLPMIEANLGAHTIGATTYVGLLTPGEFAEYRRRGFEVHYLPEMREYSLQVHGVDLARAGARVFVAPPQGEH